MKNAKTSDLERQPHPIAQNEKHEIIPNLSSTSGPVIYSLLNANSVPHGDDANETQSHKEACKTLRKIISVNGKSEFAKYKGEMTKETYQILDRIIRKIPYSEKYKPGNFVRNINRLSRSLKQSQEETATPVGKGESEPQIPLSMILPAENLENEEVVQAILESLQVLSQEFTDPTLATQEELDNLVRKVISIPEVTKIATDTTQIDVKIGLVNWLQDIAGFIYHLIEQKALSDMIPSHDSRFTAVYQVKWRQTCHPD